MAVNARNSNEKVIKERSIFTGPALVSVITVNPSLVELVSMGYKNDNEPEYVTTAEDGTIKCRLDFYVQTKDGKIKGKTTFWLENKEKINKNGDKNEFINNLCQSSWGTSAEECITREGKNGNTWFKEEGVRKALIGEVDLYNFIQNWANAALDEDCSLDNLSAIFKGDFKELKNLIKLLSANEIQVMFTATSKDGQKWYQGISNKIFGRATSKRFTSDFSNYVTRQKSSGYPLKDVWSATLMEFTPKIVVPDTDPVEIADDKEEVTF